MNPSHFQNLDRVIHERGRMAIMSLLAATAEQSFTELRGTLRMTDCNLMAHLRTLQEAGYVAVTKRFEDRKPLSTYSLTQRGGKAFVGYIEILGEIVKEAKPS